jgi:hypothetical protein
VWISAAAVAPSAASAGERKRPSGTSTINLRVVSDPDSVPNSGEQITFDVSTTATDRSAASRASFARGHKPQRDAPR